MNCFLLGSGGTMPMPRRRLTSLAVRLEGEIVLLDCGEGTQIPYKELHLGQRSLRMVGITHLHADHCLGLPGMLMLRAQMPDPGRLLVVGPPGLARFIDHVRRDLAMYINYEVEVREWAPGSTVADEDGPARILWEPLDHGVLCLGYRLEERGRPGRFDPETADRLGVPPGPARGRLQAGEPVEISPGLVVRPDQVLGPWRRGRRVAYVTDTAPTASIARLLEGADLAFVEGMFLSEHIAEAGERRHLMASQAARLALDAGVRELVLVHISPRYTDDDRPRLLEEAAAIHPRVRVGQDGELFDVPLPPD
jgi:ribonuclease Z